MAEIVVGDIVAKLRGDVTQFTQALQQASAQFRTLTQATGQVRQQQEQTRESTRRMREELEQTAQAARRTGAAWQSMLQIAGGIGLATGLGAVVSQMTQFARSTVDVGTRLDQLRATFGALANSTSAGAQQFAHLFAEAQRLGVAFEPLARGWRTLTAAASQTSLSLADQQRLMTALATEARRVGASQQELERAILAVSQMASKGKISMEELRQQLGEALVTSLAAAAQGMGRTTDELIKLVETGRVSFVPFAQALTRGFEQMQAKSGDFASSARQTFNQLGNAMLAFKDAIATNVLPELERIARVTRGILETATSIIRQAGQGGAQPAGPSLRALGGTDVQQREADRLAQLIRTLETQLQAPNQTPLMRQTREEQLTRAREQRDELLEVIRLTQDQAIAQGQVTQEANKTADALSRQKAFNDEFAKATAQIAKDTAAFRAEAALAPSVKGRPTGSTEDIEKFNKGLQEITGKQLEALASLVNQRGEDIRLSEQQRAELARLDQQHGQFGKTIDAVKEAERQRAQAAREAEADAERAARRLLDLENLRARVQQFVGRPGQTEAEEAAERVRRQGTALTTDLQQQILQIEKSPALLRQASAELATFKANIDEVRTATEAQAQLAHDAVIERQYVEPLRRLAAQYGLTKEARDADTASMLAAGAAGTKYATELTHLRDTIISLTQPLMTLPEVRSEITERLQRATGQTADLQEALDRLRTSGSQSMAERLRGQAIRDRRLLTQQDEDLLKQIQHQEQLNLVMEQAGRIGDAAAQTITNGLLNIVSGAQSAGAAFKAMGKQILDTLAELALQQGFRMLLNLGLNLLGGAVAGSLGGAAITPHGADPAATMGLPLTPTTPTTGFQHGGIINRPTFGVIGENPANNPEFIFNRHQMASLLRAAPSAGGQATGGVTVINVASREQAEATAAQERMMGKQVIVNYVLEELGQGSGSRIGQAMRTVMR